jgi:HSP20 family molecular chaperone IbpA
MATSKPALSEKLPAKAPRIVGQNDQEKFHQGIHRRVAERAYGLYEAYGHEHGNDRAHWLQAQNEILQHGLEVRESGSWLSINASLPDVDGDDIEVCLEPNRVIIRAEKSEATQTTESHTQGLAQRELFLMEDLLAEIDPETVSGSFNDQKLTLMVKKRYPVTRASTEEPSTQS